MRKSSQKKSGANPLHAGRKKPPGFAHIEINPKLCKAVLAEKLSKSDELMFCGMNIARTLKPGSRHASQQRITRDMVTSCLPKLKLRQKDDVMRAWALQTVDVLACGHSHINANKCKTSGKKLDDVLKCMHRSRVTCGVLPPPPRPRAMK